jgi:hypothetical protein
MNSGRNLFAEYDAKSDASALQKAVECFRTASMFEINDFTEYYTIAELAGILLRRFEQDRSHRDEGVVDFRTLGTIVHQIIEADMRRLKAEMNICEPRARWCFL